MQRQGALDQRLRQMAGAEAVGGELLAGQMDQPDVAVELTFLAHLEEDRGRQHQGRRGRVIVVGAAGRQAGAAAAELLVVAVEPCRRCRNGRP